MPNCKFGNPTTDLFVHCHQGDSMKDDLESLFGGDEEDIFRGVDLSFIDYEDVDISVFESSYDSEDSDGECVNSKFLENKNHDCMWGGQCCNKEYQQYQRTIPVPPPPPTPKVPAVSVPPPATSASVLKLVSIQKCVPAGKCSGGDRTDVVVVTDSVRTPIPKSDPSRSLLLNRTNQPRTPATPSPAKTPVKRELPTPQSSRPETPQSLSGSDDDLVPIPIDTNNTTSIFRSALDALTTPATAPWEDDLLAFRDVKRTKDEKASLPSQTDILRLSASAKSDHNYNLDSKNVRLEGLGVDTPSDSEEDEEIDVVSLSERSSSSRSSSCGRLPTRPTPRDQEHLEEITTSLLSASEAVSRKLKKTINTQHQVRHKRKKYESETSEDEDDEEDYDTSSPGSVYHRQKKRPRAGPSHSQSRRKRSPRYGEEEQSRQKKASRFGEEEGSQGKRDLHNNMERMRRIDLRNSFEDLKAIVPCLANKDRAAKVVILREAANYCFELGAESQSKCMQVMALRKEQERLRAMVSSLRKAAAMACIKNSWH